MPLEEWQKTLIIACVSGLIPLLFVPIREYFNDRKFKRNIKSVIISELNNSHEILEKIQSSGHMDREELVIKDEIISSELPLDTTFYDDMEVESLGKSMNRNELMKIQKIYRKIIQFNRHYTRYYGGTIRFKPEIFVPLQEDIKEILDFLEDC